MMLRRLTSVAALLALTGTLCWASAATAEAPQRVVSINLCTDQLAMLLAGPDQLYSVSFIAQDPRVSAMSREAGTYVINHGLAEEIYLMQPDLVVASAFSAQATVAMLRRLDIPVAVFNPASSLADVRDRITEMGTALHRQGVAAEMLEDFDARLTALTGEARRNPRALLYYANGYTSGDNTLAGQILLAAGFSNAANETGYAAGRKLPLEVLALTNPEIVITAREYPGASRSEAIMDHPVVRNLRKGRAAAAMTDQDWVCGTPYVLRAIESLAADRDRLIGDSE